MGNVGRGVTECMGWVWRSARGGVGKCVVVQEMWGSVGIGVGK